MFILPELPYGYDALSPTLSAETLRVHHDKHHKAYVEKTNSLAQKAGLEGRSLEDVVREAKRRGDQGLFNNAAQAWNHEFYWNSLSPKKLRPSAALARRIDSDFGSQERFADQLAKAAADQFGSGWAWLIEDAGKLAIATTSNADTPMARGKRCLLTIDVWEHAYYVDYRNQRERYLSGVIGERLNWEFAERNLGL